MLPNKITDEIRGRRMTDRARERIAAVGAALDEAEPVGDASESGPPDADESALAREPRNDLGNGRRLIARHGADMIYVAGADWHIWDERRFARGTRVRDHQTPNAVLRVHDMVDKIAAEADALEADLTARLQAAIDDGRILEAKEIKAERAAIAGAVDRHRKWGVSSGNSNKIAGALAQARPRLTRESEEMDRDPWLLTVENGTLDVAPDTRRGWVPPPADAEGCGDRALPSALLRDHDRADLITRLAPVVYDRRARAPKWEAMLEFVQPDPEIRLYLQRLFGYIATGGTGEQVFVVFWGNGKNGKSTVVQTIVALLGDYAAAVNPKVFMAGANDDGTKANPALARLRAKRFVSCSEPDDEDRIGEGLIKLVTGGGKMPVRDLFESETEVLPTWKLIFDTNHQPTIRGTDLGIWRRVHMVPWLQHIPSESQVKDYHLVLLEEEAPGILNWVIEGARMWREEGLDPPPAVVEAVEEYRRTQDPLQEFIESCTIPTPGAVGPSATDLYRAYCWWSEQNSRSPMKPNSFGRQMNKRGMGARGEKATSKYGGINHYRNLELMPVAVPPIDWVPQSERGRGGGGKSWLDRGRDDDDGAGLDV